MPSTVRHSMKPTRSDCMVIDAKLPEGYVILCADGVETHSFLVASLGLAVECPQCGATRLSVDLATAFYLRDREALCA